MAYQSEIVINRPVKEVFEYITTFENFPKWSETHSVKVLTNGTVGVGTRLLIEMGKGPMKSRNEFDTVEWEKDRTWAFKTVSPASSVVWDGSFDFEPVGPASTRVRADGQVSLKGWRRLLEPVIRGELQKGEQGELETVKRLIEGTG
ncbi:MAG: SRPBCC family protein [Acidimicrobiia bacterium]